MSKGSLRYRATLTGSDVDSPCAGAQQIEEQVGCRILVEARCEGRR